MIKSDPIVTWTCTGCAALLSLHVSMVANLPPNENTVESECKRIALLTLATFTPFIASYVPDNNKTTFRSLAFSALCFCVASQISGVAPIPNYQNPTVLKQLRQEAPNLTFDQLLDKHRAYNLISHQILDKKDILSKFKEACKRKSIEEMLHYPLDELWRSDLIPTQYFHEKFFEHVEKNPLFVRDHWYPASCNSTLFFNYTLPEEVYNKLVTYHDQLSEIENDLGCRPERRKYKANHETEVKKLISNIKDLAKARGKVKEPARTHFDCICIRPEPKT